MVVIHHIFWQRPALLVFYERRHVRQTLSHATTVRQFKSPKIVFRRRKYLADCGHRFEIEQRIAVGFRASQLLRKAAIRGHLIRQQNSLEAIAAKGEQLLVARQRGELCNLHDPACAVIVLCLTFIDTIQVRCHPLKIIREPLLNPFQFVRR